MLLIDVNVLIYAHRADIADHIAVASWMQELVNGNQPFGIASLALSSFLRIVTRLPFSPPHANCRRPGFLRPPVGFSNVPDRAAGGTALAHLSNLCRDVQATGKLVPDAYFAAIAIELGCEWITADSDFSRFPGLTWRHPSADHATTNPR